MARGIMRRMPPVTPYNAPLYQARKRTSPYREALDAYLGAPTTISGDRFGLKWKQYQKNLAIYFRDYLKPRRRKDWWRASR